MTTSAAAAGPAVFQSFRTNRRRNPPRPFSWGLKVIRVTVEMLPHGREEGRRTLGVMNIKNDGSGNEATGNYLARLHAEYGTRRGELLSFNRRQQSVWSLVGAFLKLFGHTRHSPKLMKEDK